MILHASFDHLKVVYNMEINSTLKQAFKLTLKSLFPHSIERENVRLALNFFNDSTAALINMGPKHAQLERHFHIYISYYKVVGYAEH